VPVERISKGFRDISATFQINPINDDLIALKNENAIARSVRNLIMTVPGDKPFQPEVGSRVTEMLFENMDKLTANLIRSEIKNTLVNYERRIDVREVLCEPDYDNNEYNVTINYIIVGIDADEQQLSFALVATR
jgi:phage baseplate assembly protein W